MTDEKKKTRQEREEDATRDLIAAYAKLVALASDVSVGRKSKALNEIVSEMSESQVRAMLMVRIAVDSVASDEILQRLSEAPLESLGENPTLH